MYPKVVYYQTSMLLTSVNYYTPYKLITRNLGVCIVPAKRLVFCTTSFDFTQSWKIYDDLFILEKVLYNLGLCLFYYSQTHQTSSTHESSLQISIPSNEKWLWHTWATVPSSTPAAPHNKESIKNHFGLWTIWGANEQIPNRKLHKKNTKMLPSYP